MPKVLPSIFDCPLILDLPSKVCFFGKLPSKWSFDLAFPAVLGTAFCTVGWSHSNAELNGSVVFGSTDLLLSSGGLGYAGNLLLGVSAPQILPVPLIQLPAIRDLSKTRSPAER